MVKPFHSVLPSANVYVIDNASVDATSKVAAEAAAVVIAEPLRGKGMPCGEPWRIGRIPDTASKLQRSRRVGIFCSQFVILVRGTRRSLVGLGSNVRHDD